ncbi:integrase arm-type DNA-binding domain-containing protein [Reyranella sp.]|jgi:integrase|uniref:tyrosine-type recombinase/integrase n=1 Tax=Reyranella sp. TaxID=1929291 RepID=UPI000BD2E59D|nr:integrase arm-type DNA-binding domain-containing protein [Reyranella sp.]OYY40235.1 MAG: integrase [Rhodospirillales bacterium 35-66-84]OYZ92787.1 MAG: integrase [Rhodospirillales bacterium 24-66-33]OZB22508.1 MAG: integrase [Rhodospirillales bacterium 39-66-50]HQS16425.1 tyrosine-type recombinase/integrase [Reyranella sp.]HQT12256.1 tyrosine-type recombinase/integrase [Reyranella sp.]
MLTDVLIRKAKAPAKPTKLMDERGLFLMLTPSGGRWWRFRYSYAGKEKLLSLGTYPDVSLKAAREARDDARKMLAKGIDPSAVRQEEKRAKVEAGANTFAAVAREWLENVKPKWAAVYHSDTEKRFEAYVFPDVGRRPIAELTAPELLAVLRKIEARGTVETAHKVARACGQVFRYGIATGRCDRNPTADLRDALKARPKVKHMAALPASELPDFLRKIDGYDGELQTRLALRLLALTFVRTNELRGATWAEIDLDKAEWTIPAERMKTKAPHHVPLSEQAVEAFRMLQAINGKWPWVFAGRTPSTPMSKNTVLFALYRLGYHGRMTGHGFRALASTALNEMGFRPDVIERQLAHVEKNAVRAAYHRSQYLEERTAMMQAWADHLDAQRAADGKVVAIGQARRTVESQAADRQRAEA